MAITKTEVQVTWPTAVNSKSVAASGNQTSEEATLDATAIAGLLVMKADNDGTPASGDTIDFYILENAGDPDGAGSDEFVTTGHGRFLGQLDTNGEDPAIIARDISVVGKSFKLYVENNSGGRAITVSATLYEQRAA
jgi:hypothetical protein